MRPSGLVGSLRRAGAVATVTAALTSGLATATLAAPATPATDSPVLYLVTLEGGGASSHRGLFNGAFHTAVLESRQDRVLDAVGAGDPVYRWTTALNGVAVPLTAGQARALAATPGVVSVERNAVRRVAATPSRATLPTGSPARATGGAGVVIGIVDSGLDEGNPLFTPVPAVGRSKVVRSRWFIHGFGEDNVRSTSALSPADDTGHGTLVASVAAGNSGVSVRVGAQSFGAYAGTAPSARIAVYKACWSAPDPSDDGCATADLVTAIDRATADGVDVLNLAVAGASTLDTVDRALLGATEGGVFVAAAAGNNGRDHYAAHPVPWVTTVGAVTGPIQGGTISWKGGSLSGAMSSQRSVRAGIVQGRDIAAPAATRNQAAQCLPGSLDAGRAAGRIVVCERGTIGRVDKSSTVALADGVGMVLTNPRGSDLHADFQRVPTLHLTAADARQLRARLRAHPATRATLRPGPSVGDAARVTRWSATGDPRGDLVKPDLTATGVDVLGAVPPGAGSPTHWSLYSGTSVATAQVSGEAAVLVAQHPRWSPARVRSALMTTARTLPGDQSSLGQGAGRVRTQGAARPGLVYDLRPSAYRRYLSGEIEGRDLNLPSIMVAGAVVVRRTVTNVGPRAMYYSVRARGLRTHRVSITPVAVRLAPGASRTFTVRITGTDQRRVDSGWITWRGANGISVRIPLVISE
ncbi:S8 family serine peptidase [Nocardioides sp.]|uniref:S8 family serine peptidase n=1 Tax=Nocardioides sp. TaxID=35761 RepID=UPI003D13EB60